MICYSCLSPHPPIILPAVGGEELKHVHATVAGLQNLATRLVASSPEVLVFLTPHGNVFADCISCLGEADLNGNLGNFGHPELGVELPNDLELVNEIKRRALAEEIDILTVDKSLARRYRLNPDIDHGTLVPLYYLQQAGLGPIPIVVISIGYLPVFDLYRCGCIIADAAAALNRKVAIVASGDMSHRLKDDGPYNFNPDGPRFDGLMKDLLEKQDIEGLLHIPEKLRDNAGECGYRSVVIMLGALDGLKFDSRVFSYEGPFGVGYLVAGFKPAAKSTSLLQQMEQEQVRQQEERRCKEPIPVKWARLVLENYINQGEMLSLPDEFQQLKEQRAGAFVSLKKGGKLRGCIGTILPCYSDLAAEIQANAISAGTRDPRFAPVKKQELNQLEYSVDVLSEPQPCTRAELDPGRYGVIVSHGHKRGVLLPDLEGVDTVEEQVEIALQKAGISRGQDYTIERFEVIRYK